MKGILFILLAGSVGAAAEGVYSGAPNPGWVRHGAGGPTGLQLLGLLGALALACVLPLLPWRQRPLGARVVLSRAAVPTPAYVFPTLLLLVLGGALTWLKDGGVAAGASVFFATMTGLVLLHQLADQFDRWREASGAGLSDEKVERLELGLLTLAEVGSTGALLFLLAFLPSDCAALGLTLFALGQALVVHAQIGGAGSFRCRLLFGNLRGNAVVIALIYLMQTAFQPTSIEAVVLVEFSLGVRMLVPLCIFVASRLIQPALVAGLAANEAVELRRWLRCVSAMGAVFLTSFMLLDRVRAEGFQIHRDLWWSLCLPLCIGLGVRLVGSVSPLFAGSPLLGAFFASRAVVELEAMRYLIFETHEAMPWALAWVLLAWGWFLGDHVRGVRDSAESSPRPEVEALTTALVGLVLVFDWFAAPRPHLSLIDFKVLTGVLLGVLLHRALAGSGGGATGASWRLPALSFVFPVVGLGVGLPMISVFMFASALVVTAALVSLSPAVIAGVTRVRIHFAGWVGVMGLGIAVEVLRSMGDAKQALPVRWGLAALLIGGGIWLARICQRPPDRARQAS